MSHKIIIIKKSTFPYNQSLSNQSNKAFANKVQNLYFWQLSVFNFQLQFSRIHLNMKILHTSDWHLGQKFLNNDRYEEHKRALEWLLQTIDNQSIDILIIAGDIFDTTNPPNNAKKLYYDFLSNLQLTNCRHVVIIGGNHDSASLLNAPRDLLKTYLNVHVVGCVTEHIQDEIIELRDKNDTLEAVIAAIPFLRDSDIRKSVAGQSFDDREKQVRAGITKHYQTIAEEMLQYEELNIPIIATGHLSVLSAGATDEKESKIYVGSLENITPNDFPTLFDYIALGHIHKAQPINSKFKHIRYSGTLIPLHFTEKTTKSITVLDFEGRNFSKEIINVPMFREIILIEGTFEEVIFQLQALEITEDLTAWIEVKIQHETMIPDLMDKLKGYIEGKNALILNFRIHTSLKYDVQSIAIHDLKALTEVDVFRQKCTAAGYNETDTKDLTYTFNELLNWMEDQEDLSNI